MKSNAFGRGKDLRIAVLALASLARQINPPSYGDSSKTTSENDCFNILSEWRDSGDLLINDFRNKWVRDIF